MCASSPDMTIANEAAARNAQISQDALDWYKQQYADTAPQRQQASDLALKQSTLQNELSQEALTTSQEQNQRYKDTFEPIENRIASDAMNYDTPAARQAAAAAASADVQTSLDAQRQASQRAQERTGVLPNSGRSLALAGSYDLGAAKLKAGAANTARQQVQTIGAAKLADAAGLGRGVVSNQATQAQIGLQSGNSAVGNAGVPLAVASQGAQLMGQGFNTALQGNTSAANINLGMAKAQSGVDAANSQTAEGAGTAVAGIAMAI